MNDVRAQRIQARCVQEGPLRRGGLRKRHGGLVQRKRGERPSPKASDEKAFFYKGRIQNSYGRAYPAKGTEPWRSEREKETNDLLSPGKAVKRAHFRREGEEEQWIIASSVLEGRIALERRGSGERRKVFPEE